MALTNFRSGAGYTQAADAYTPEGYGQLVQVAVLGQSIAAQSFGHHSTNRDKVLFPKWVSNPAVAHYSELDTIALADPTTAEVEVSIYKTGGANRQSRELVADSTPGTAELVAAGFVQQIIRAVDGAMLGNTTTKGPNGLLSTDYTSVEAASISSLDAFVEAKYAALAHGGNLTNWIMSPAVAETISKLKVQSGSLAYLVQFVENGMTIAGVPVLVSDQTDANTFAWGISRSRNVLVVREGTRVERSTESAFLEDGVDLKATFRYGLGFLHEEANVRIWHDGS